VLVHPALLVLQMGAVIFLAPDGNQDTRWLARFEDRHHMVGLGVLKVVQNEFVPSTIVSVTFWRLQNRSAPLFGPVLDPVLKPIGDAGEVGSCDSGALPVGIEETEDSLGLLEGLDEAIQQEPVEAPVAEFDAILVMLVKGVHGGPPVWSDTWSILP